MSERDELPQPGTDEQRERYNDLPLDYGDAPALNPPDPADELAAGTAELTDSGVIGMSVEDQFGASARPTHQSPMAAYQHKFGGG